MRFKKKKKLRCEVMEQLSHTWKASEEFQTAAFVCKFTILRILWLLHTVSTRSQPVLRPHCHTLIQEYLLSSAVIADALILFFFPPLKDTSSPEEQQGAAEDLQPRQVIHI